MIKAITSVIQIQDVMLARNPEFDLTKMGIYDSSDPADILGSESLNQARRVVGRKGIAWEKPLDAGVALERAKNNQCGRPASWADDGSGLYARNQHYIIPVLREKPKASLTKCGIQPNTELLITTRGRRIQKRSNENVERNEGV